MQDQYKPTPPKNAQQANAYAHALAPQLWAIAHREYQRQGRGAIVVDLRIAAGPDQDWVFYAPIALLERLTGQPIPPGVKQRLTTYPPDRAMFVLIFTPSNHWLIELEQETPTASSGTTISGSATHTIAAFERAIALLEQHPNDRHHVAYLEPFLAGIRAQLAEQMSKDTTPAKTA